MREFMEAMLIVVCFLAGYVMGNSDGRRDAATDYSQCITDTECESIDNEYI